MSRIQNRRIILELDKASELTIEDPLGLVGKTVTLIVTGAVVRDAMVKAARRPANASAEIVLDVDTAEIVEVI